MRRRPPSDVRPRRQAGFTLVELVLVIVLTGVLATFVGRIVLPPVLGYLSTSARARLTDVADGALRRIGRDLHIALPNSVRINAAGTSLELIPTTGAARYQTEGSGALVFGSVDTDFDLIGPGLTLSASSWLVFYNLGPGVVGSDAYAASTSASEQASSNRRRPTQGAGVTSHLTLQSLAGLPVGDFAPPYRVFAVESPRTYRCDLSAGTLTLYWDYGFQAAQPDPPTGGQSALLADGVQSCHFSVDATAVAARADLIGLQLQLATTTTAGTETVSLHHAVHVDNLP